MTTCSRAMDDAGVAKAAIVHSSTAYGYDNSYVADAVAAVPSRFTGVYSIDVLAPDAVKTFDYWLGRGCTGMRLFTTGSTMPGQATWFADPKTYPFWEHAAAKNIPVCVQMKQEGIPLLRADHGPVSQGDDHSRSPVEHVRARMDRPTPARTRSLRWPSTSRSISRSRPINVTPRAGWGKGDPATFFGKIVRHVRRRAHRLGFQLPELDRHAEGDFDRGAEGFLLRQVVRAGLDLRQDRAGALSEPEGLTAR